MARTRASVKKATKPVEEHSSSATIVCESESSMPMEKKELGIRLSQQQDLRKQVSRTISKLKWETFGAHPGSNSPSLDATKINDLYNTKVDVDEHSKKGIVPRDDEEVLENKVSTNEVSIERMTRGKDTPTMKEAETSKIRKGKTKAESKGTNLTAETSLLCKMKDIEKLANSISNKQIRLVATIEDMIDSLIEGDVIAGQEAPAIEEDIVVEKEDVHVEVVNEKAEEENIATEAARKIC
ncbi:hypothetical protein PVK06_043157 [Gossypium arboreum]|uniref:Uncharacterized protein n=1 Tax=Gossypium arboreum TaxID=29729 RepID=A0ABR0MMS1_GOSAR|nr:hypothetical protein PVK06_043157 [Gossypium arboreum]